MALQLIVGYIEVGQLRKGVDGVWKALETVAAEVEVGQGLVISDNVGYLSGNEEQRFSGRAQKGKIRKGHTLDSCSSRAAREDHCPNEVD